MAGYLPEIAIVAVIVALLVVDMFMTRAGSKKLAWLALAGVGVAMFLVSRQMGADLGTVGQFGALKDGALVDPMLLESQTSRFFQMLFLIGTAVTIVFSYLSNELADRPMGEYYIVLLSALLGCFVMSEANNLLLIFVAIELLSIPSYVLTGYMKRDRASSEASVKYVIYGSVASGIMLYGFSLIYGMTGSLQLDKMTQLFSLGAATPYAAGVALLLSFVGFAYKLAAVPLHFWAPDVYRGAPTPITAWLAVVSKAAGIIVFLRFMSFVMPGPATELAWGKLLALVAAVTMTLGNLAALQQTSLKRMLAYSSVAHVGYILMGVAAADFGGAGAGWHAVTFYTVAYLAMNLGAFGCVMLAQNKLGSDEISKFAGLGLRAPLISVCLAVCVISLL
ncbi:MAG: NADH-quinone oxidoreductase subunit N, partial [Planctomycetota bacterium]